MSARRLMPSLFVIALASAPSAPAFAQSQLPPLPTQAQGRGQDDAGGQGQRGSRVVQPYIEVGQIVSAQLSPGDDVVTFTQVAVGVDVNLQGRNSGAAVSLRY
ncbi:MAG: hypothetical protein ACKO1N_05740 [Erythrobacter sp.]